MLNYYLYDWINLKINFFLFSNYEKKYFKNY